MIPFDFHYQYPRLAYLLLLSFLTFFLMWQLLVFRRKIKFLPEMVQPSSVIIFTLKAVMSSAAIAFIVLALMQPIGNGHYPKGSVPAQKSENLGTHPIELKRKVHDVIFLLDASASMGIQDARLQKSRLEYAKVLADELISSLKGENVALYAFTSTTSELSPLTLDYIYARLALKEIQINEGAIAGTDIASALAEMGKRYLPAGQPVESSGLKTLILFSDGGDTSIEALPAAEQAKAIAALAKIVQAEAAKHHLRVYTIGMGSNEGGIVPAVSDQGKPVHSRLEKPLLEAIAKHGRGHYYEANRFTPGSLAKVILADMAQDPPYFEKKPQEVQNALLQNLIGSSQLVFDRYFQVPIAFALLALAFMLFFPDRWKLNLWLLLLGMMPVLAQENVSSPDLLHAQGYVEAHMYDQARAVYERMLLSPSSDYQESALRYNVATTYLLEHSWEQAIAQLKEVIAKMSFGASLSASSELLKKRIYRNLALAYYEKATEKASKFPLDTLQDLQLASNANRLLPENEREPLESAIKRTMAFKQLSEAKIRDKNLFQSMLRLLHGVENSQEGLHFLEEKSLFPAIKTSYHHLFLEEQEAWLPIWDAHETKFDSMAAHLSFQEAKKMFNQMIAATAQADIHAALQAAKASQASLFIVLKEIAGGNMLQVRLLQLLSDYQRLLERRSWPAEQIERINQLYLSLAKMEEDAILQTLLMKSRQSFQEAVKARQASRVSLINLLAQDGLRWLQLALAKSQYPSTSVEELTVLIEQQKYAQRRLFNYQNAAEGPDDRAIVLEIVKASQLEVLTLAESFYVAVLAEQRAAYQKGLCQAVPWGEAFPLFEAGRQAAAAGNTLLHSKEAESNRVLVFQAEAIQQWEKALAEIKNPTAQHSTCYRDESKATTDNSQFQSLTSLLKMEAEDRKPAQSIPVQSSHDKPW